MEISQKELHSLIFGVISSITLPMMSELGFPAKRVNFFTENFEILHISFARKKCENVSFFAKFRFNLFREKMRNFREIRNAKRLY